VRRRPTSDFPVVEGGEEKGMLITLYRDIGGKRWSIRFDMGGGLVSKLLSALGAGGEVERRS